MGVYQSAGGPPVSVRQPSGVGPVLYATVDVETGATETWQATSWPTLNAQHFYAVSSENAKVPDIVQPGRSIAASAPVRVVNPPRQNPSRAEEKGKLHQLFLYGLSESSKKINETELWGHAGIPEGGGLNEVVAWENISFLESLRTSAIKAMKRISDAATLLDTVLLDINCHGAVDASGRYFMFAPNGTDTWIFGGNTSEDEMLRIEDLNVPACHACEIVVLVGHGLCSLF